MSNGLIFGISKIGDLLIRNKITETDAGGALENIKLVISEYELEYKS